jgi:hypothetical protein
MFSADYINSMNRKAARAASAQRQEPYVPFDAEEVQNMRGFPFPYLATYKPKGWKKVEELFCDASGFGSESEPALTIRALKAKMVEYLDKPETYGYAVLSCGQFQVYVGVYLKK